MKRILSTLLFLLTFSAFINSSSLATSLEDCDNSNIPSDKISDCISVLSKKVTDLADQKKTIASQIAQFDNQIKITQLKISDSEATIAQLEKEISVLGFRIGYISESVNKLEEVLKHRIVVTYQQSNVSSLEIMLGSNDFQDFMQRIQYLRIVQENDRKVLANLQQSKANYANQKDDREEKQAQIEENKKKLEVLGASLNTQKVEKQKFLAITKNDEKRYQQLLEQTRAEFEAIQAIIAGNGIETEVGHINEGQKIATIIQGASCNSFGTHLHFTVRKSGGVTDNPFNYLKGGISYEENSGGDSFNPSGNWEWPISPSIEFNQGYGVTAAIRSHIVWYSFHNGIDISSLSSSEVRAVKSGTLFRGTYSGNGGCALRYVRVDHEDSDFDTLYLHVNYLL